MGPVDVRRLAALDMYGGSGSRLRRTIIVAEFLLGAVGGTAAGVFALLTVDGIAGKILGAWVAMGCLNYVPLSLHALPMLRSEALEEELSGVDIQADLGHYTRLQFWLVVPLLFIVIAVPQALGRRPAANG